MNPRISVIIPVYNVEKYIEKCIRSILAQTFKDIEIILVDDGSTDKSKEICDKYAENNKNIMVIHKHNTGPSETRNYGIKFARGELIYFVDSDDYLIPECLELLYKNLIENDADISCGNFGFFDDDNPFVLENIEKKNHYVRNGRKACILLLYGKDYYSSSCNILMKRGIAENNLFPVGRFHEDEMTTFRYFLSASKIVKTSVNTYYYYQRVGSIMHSLGPQIVDEIESGDYYVDVCKNIDKRMLKAALCKKYSLYCETIETYEWLKDNEPLFYNRAKEYIEDNSINIILDIFVPLRIKRKAFKYIIKK